MSGARLIIIPAQSITRLCRMEKSRPESPSRLKDSTKISEPWCIMKLRLLIPSKPSGICRRSEEHTSELQSLMRISYAVFCLKKNKKATHKTDDIYQE